MMESIAYCAKSDTRKTNKLLSIGKLEPVTQSENALIRKSKKLNTSNTIIPDINLKEPLINLKNTQRDLKRAAARRRLGKGLLFRFNLLDRKSTL